MAFGHAQLLLYRPFLHYVSQGHKDKNVDQRAFACASACVSVSRNIIHISTEMRKRGLLAGAYWFSMYTTFFAIVSILYFVLENPTSPTSFELLRDAVEGKEVLTFFAQRSMAADRCSTALKVRPPTKHRNNANAQQSMFERLPESIRHGGELIESKKRRQASSPQSIGARPNFIKQDDFMGPRRASTFPESIPDAKRTAHGHALPLSSTHLASLGLESAYGSPAPSNPDFYDAVPGLTPNSSNASLGTFGNAAMHNPQQSSSFPPTPLVTSFTDTTGLNIPLSDISTMMFPSADPLAYPNQPMTTFENKHPHVFERSTNSPVVGGVPPQLPTGDIKSHPAMFAPTSMPAGPGRRMNENEAQLFGSMPLYLMQGAQSYRGFPPQNGSPHMQMAGPNMQFDDLLNHDEWAQTFLDPAMGMNNGRPPLGSNHQFGQQGAGMGPWR